MRRTLLVGAVLSLFVALPQAGFAQSSALDYPVANGYYFGETGHTVHYGFWDFYRSIDGSRVLGFPISEEFTEDGMTVQYFERARLEYHPGEPTGKDVVMAAIGRFLTANRSFEQVPSFPSSSSHRFFSETGYPISNGFKKFWEANDGSAMFGFPISGEIQERGRTVQYFERARFEYQPELPAGQEVQLGLIGKQWFKAQGHTASPLDPQPARVDTPSTTTVTARITGYTSREGGSRTFTGKQCAWGIVAVDPHYIPLGSKIWIDGFPGVTFRAEDTGSAVRGYWIDVWVSPSNSAMAYAITGHRTITFEPPE